MADGFGGSYDPYIGFGGAYTYHAKQAGFVKQGRAEHFNRAHSGPVGGGVQPLTFGKGLGVAVDAVRAFRAYRSRSAAFSGAHSTPSQEMAADEDTGAPAIGAQTPAITAAPQALPRQSSFNQSSYNYMSPERVQARSTSSYLRATREQ